VLFNLGFQVYTSGFLIGLARPLLGPTLAAITMGLVSGHKFDTQFARNQGFNSAGNVASALLIGLIGYRFGYRAVFLTAAFFAIPSLISLSQIDPTKIDNALARGSTTDHRQVSPQSIWQLLQDRGLLFFLVSVFLFHLSNAAMLPQLGELLSKGNARTAAPFMSACIIVTQLVIAAAAAWVGKKAHQSGRRPLLLLGFGVLPVRGVLYTLTAYAPLLVAIQVLDGIANAIYLVVGVLVVADLTRGTGRFNLTQGALGVAQGLGAAASTTFAGSIVHHYGYDAGFLSLSGIALVACGLLWFAMPESKDAGSTAPNHPATLPVEA